MHLFLDRLRDRLTASLATSMLVLVTGVAAAGPGDHIRTGDTTLTPDVDVGFEYRTNVYRASEDPTAGANMRVAPGVQLGVDSPQNAFDLAGEWEIRKFLYLDVPAAERPGKIRAVDRYNDFNFRANLNALRQESVGLVVTDQVTLRNNEVDRGVWANPFTTQVRNALTAGLRLSPGDALDIVPGGHWSYDDFRVADTDPFRTRFNSRHAFGPSLDVSWRFFPRTGFVLRGEGTWNQWSDNSVGVTDPVSAVAGVIEVPNSFHVRAVGGLEGRFTERVFIDVLVGYGNAIYEPSAIDLADELASLKGAAGVIGSAQLRYKLVREEERSLEAGVGFKRDFADSFFTNYVLYNQAFAQIGATVARFRPTAKYSVRFEDYSGGVVRHDVLNRFDTGVGYAFKEWGEVAAGVSWQQRGVVETPYQSTEYDEFIVRLLSTFTY